MLERWIADKLDEAVKCVSAAALLGPCQVGKTTLAREIAEKRNSIYLDLESPEDLLKLRDPVSCLSGSREKLLGL
ncbi:MAG: hypothetical protein OXH71_06040 [Candidatus Dadabacteria bacterium]|nr:hypothetical protein [Candidatus Dadabacteria bacterium]MDE0520233.1 hypothetical protein [Candidatus Dadabacteria bacterium]MDE0662354.1 hypothetical protein [Candidatus Dadabacteria bacterium]